MTLPIPPTTWPGRFPSFQTPRTGNITVHADIINIASKSDSPNDHHAFPGLIYDNRTGNLVVVYRTASGHMPSDPGTIVMKVSDDFGASWSTPTVIAGDGILDVRDPELTMMSNGTYVVPYFSHTNAVGAAAVIHTYVIKSTDYGATWSTPVEVDAGWTHWTACSGPVVQAANGDWVFAVYGHDTGATYDSTRVMRSTNQGATWGGMVEVANGPAVSTQFQEPNVGVLPDGRTMMVLMRGTSQIHRATSWDYGQTWSGQSIAFPGSGRPSWRSLNSGAVVAIYRNNSANEAAVRTSWDSAYSWTAPTIFDVPPLQYAYGSMYEVTPGAIAVAYTSEDSLGLADLDFRYFLDGTLVTGTDPLDYGVPSRAGRRLLIR